MEREGSLSFRLRVPQGYWQSRGEPCRFAPIAAEGLFLEVVLTETHALEVFIDGPLGRAWSLSSAPITHGPAALAIALTWSETGVLLYLDGKRVASAAV